MNTLIAEAQRLALSLGQPPVSNGTPVVYFLRLRSGVIYIGASENLEQRLEDHVSGRGGRTTSFGAPISVCYLEFHFSFSAARLREAQLKRWSRAKKEALIRGDPAELTRLAKSREAHR